MLTSTRKFVAGAAEAKYGQQQLGIKLLHVKSDTLDPRPRPKTLGDIPLVVIRHGRPVLPLQGAITPEVSQAYERVWAQMQDELAALSPQGRLVVAEGSGHGVQVDRPDVVIAAIRDVLAATR